MFNAETLLVLGAGASAEVSFPTGHQLRSVLAGKLDFKPDKFGDNVGNQSGDFELWQALEQHARSQKIEKNEYFKACHVIRDGILLSQSIDDFLNIHSTNREINFVGKLAIAKSILGYEKKSPIFFDVSNAFNKMDFNVIQDTWYSKFFRILSKGVADRNKLFSNISVVNFNYDKSLEHFLIHAIKSYYGGTQQEAAECLSGLRIFHPYGTVGQLADKISNYHGVSYGSADSRPEYLVSCLRTYTEQIEDKNLLDEIRRMVLNSKRIIFLGFGFHEQNMSLLKVDAGERRTIYATAQGISEADTSIILTQLLENGIGTGFSNNSTLIRRDLSCSMLFDEYWKTFSYGV